jgi:DNA polymerase sigma
MPHKGIEHRESFYTETKYKCWIGVVCFIKKKKKDSFTADITLHKTLYHTLHKQQKCRRYGKTSQAENRLAQNTNFHSGRRPLECKSSGNILTNQVTVVAGKQCPTVRKHHRFD